MFLEIFATFASLLLAVVPTSGNTFDKLSYTHIGTNANFPSYSAVSLDNTSSTFYCDNIEAESIYYLHNVPEGNIASYNISTPDLSALMFQFYVYDDGQTSGRLNFHLSIEQENRNLCNLQIMTSIKFHKGSGTTLYWYRDVLDYTYPHYVYDSFDVFQNQGMEYPSIGYTVYDLDSLYFDFSVTLVPMNYTQYIGKLDYAEYSYQDGYDVGYHDGEIHGFNEGTSASGVYSFSRLFGAIADTPIMIVRQLLNFDVFGVNMIYIFMTMITGCIVLYLFRKIVRI